MMSEPMPVGTGSPKPGESNVPRAPVLDREEYIEQAYFFRVFRERLRENMAAQDILTRAHEEILSTTKLPLAIQFLATESKHSGLLTTGFKRLTHYFTSFQSMIIGKAEQEGLRFSMDTALQVLEGEAEYRTEEPSPAGLFVYQFEVLARNKLGYDEGLSAMAEDGFYDDDWCGFIELVRRNVGEVEFADLIHVRSELAVREQQRRHPDQPPPRALFGEKEGKIARASRGRDPLFLFSALQRQLGYPEVPRAVVKEDPFAAIPTILAKLQELELKIKLLDSEVRGQADVVQQLGKPESVQPIELD